MIFNSLPFLVFIAIFFPLFYLLRGNNRLYLTLAASYFFYGWWDWRFLSLLAISTVIDYSIGLRLENESDTGKRKLWLVITLVSNLGILGFFKYFNFFVNSFNDVMMQMGMGTTSNLFHIILPVGISFYTFQTLSYTIDVYYKKIPAETSFLKFATFISFFPQLVAGPIVRASDFIPQLYDNFKKPLKENILPGLDQVCLGFIKKIVIADSLAPVVEGAFENPSAYSSLHLIVSLVFYSFQIYCDFSGYSDIAIGLARMLGYTFPMNFNKPYLSASFSEFWTRWHISLSSWLRDYLYIPLGGNRHGKFNTYRNLFLTMLLGGLWHGANWTFVFWGFLHGLYLVVQRMLDGFYKRFNIVPASGLPRFAFKVMAILLVYIAVCYAWIYFRAPDFATASAYVKGILYFDDMSFNSLVHKFWVIKGLFLISILFLLEFVSTRINLSSILERRSLLRPTFYAFAIWAIAFLGTFAESQFIYFQF